MFISCLSLLAMAVSSHLGPMPEWERYYGAVYSADEKQREIEYQKLSDPIIFNWHSGLKVKIYPNNDLGRVLYISGTYEPNSLILLKRLLSENSVFFDIGANVGIFSISASRWVGEGGQVIAFEPSSRERKFLADNILLNDLTNVRVEPVAISKQSGLGILNLAIDKHNGQNTLCRQFAYEGVSSGETESVEVMTIDDYVCEHNISRVDVIKMDIEGAEYDALQGASETLKKMRPSLIFEVVKSALDKNGIEVLELEKWIRSHGYALFRIDDFTAELIPCTLAHGKDGNFVALPSELLLSEHE